MQYSLLQKAFTVRSCIWAFMLVLSSGIFVFEMVQMADDYRSQPTLTSISTKHESVLTLPEFTFCNLERLNATAMTEAGIPLYLQTAITIYFTRLDYRKFGFNDVDVDTMQSFDKRAQNITRKQVSAEIEALMRQYGNFKEFVLRFGLDCEKLLLSCGPITGGQPRNACCDSVSALVHYHFAKCYRFPRTQQNYVGEEGGQSFLINFPRSTPAGTVVFPQSLFRGIAIDVGYDLTEPTMDYLYVEPGYLVDLKLSATVFHRHSLTNCLEPLADYWTTQGAFFACWQDSIKLMCGCRMLGLVDSSSLPICIPEKFQRTCWSKNETIFWASFKECFEGRGALCYERKYQKFLSMVRLDNIAPVLEVFTERAGVTGVSPNSVTIIKAYYSDNIAWHIFEVERYTLETFVSNVCGQAGMWLGVSLFGIVSALFSAYDKRFELFAPAADGEAPKRRSASRRVSELCLTDSA